MEAYERELIREIKKSNALIANTPGGVITFSIKNGSIKTEFISDGVCRLFGYSHAEMMEGFRQTDNFCVHHDDVDRVNIAVRQAVSEISKFNEQYRIRKKNGTVIWINLTGNPVKEEDGTITFYCSYTDITSIKEMKEYQEHLTAALEEAKKANAAKTEFLSNMSHDIRTPMNAIINMTQILRDDYSGVTWGNVMDDIDKIETSSRFLMGLLNDILDMSRIESGKMKLNPDVYSYEEFLNYISCVFEPLCRERKQTFLFDKGTTAFPLYIDKTRFNQIFFNVLSNAVKYTPEGGTIKFRTYNNRVEDGNLKCDFSITDNGCGMSREFQKKMFLPFEREKGAVENKGTGLGLAIVKNLVEIFGGKLQIESELNKGTCVMISMALPIATQEQLDASQTNIHKKVSHLELSGKHILVAEDNTLNMVIIERLLAVQGAKITKAYNGQEAYDIFCDCPEGTFDAIMMDVRMPLMDGMEATKKIRSTEKRDGENIPIIAMTANAFEEDRKLAREAGMTEYLTKPVERNLMYETIQRVIAK